MFIKKIPPHDQSLILASSRITTFKNVVEELIYNALDAESTSIAVRVHIKQTAIQVIDNGCGITKKDLNVTGQRYMTSKYADKLNSKSFPNIYGYRGESLANIVEVSKTVRITSRYESSDETWEKCFHNGKIENIIEVGRRPAKGTTIEIKGFLYNLKLQTKRINGINELQEIKLFLEHIALVHSNISLSLRDDSANEIIFQLRKKRDIYQTILDLYGLDKSEIQELKVEKKLYSVTAFIAKQIRDINKECIFLNQKYVHNTSRLHKVVNSNLNKCINNKHHRKKTKFKSDDEEMYLFKNKLPFYFLFIQCPLSDYDIIDKLIEFNNWDQITKLLEKLVKFYMNDINLKTITNKKTKEENKNVSEDTREQVKKIMNKILSSNSKTVGVSQMQNGIKGKITKRKHKKKHKTDLKLISQSKFNTEHNKQLDNKNDAHISISDNNNIQHNTIPKTLKLKLNKKLCNDRLNKAKNKYAYSDLQSINKFKHTHVSNLKGNPLYVSNIRSHISLKTISKKKNDISYFMNDPVIRRFINPSESVKNRCEILAQKAQKVLNHINNRISVELVDKSVQYSDKYEHYKSINTCKKTEYKHNYHKIYLQQRKTDKLEIENKHNNIKSNYDLLRTIMNTQANNGEVYAESPSILCHKNKFTNYEYKSHCISSEVINPGPIMSKLTYESHNYGVIRSKNLKLKKSPINVKFMSTKSKDNCITSDNNRRPKTWQRHCTYSRHLNERQQTFVKNITLVNDDNSYKYNTMQDIEEYSEIFKFPNNNLTNNQKNTTEVNRFLSNITLSNYQTENKSLLIQNTYQNISHNMDLILDQTYNLPKDYTINNKHMMYLQKSIHLNAASHHTFNGNIGRSGCVFTEGSNCTDFNRITNEKGDLQSSHNITNSQNSCKSKANDIIYAPMDICEVVYLSNDLFEKECNFNNKQKQLHNIDGNPNEKLCNLDKDDENHKTKSNIENTSHHFSITDNIQNSLRSNIEPDKKANTSSIVDKKQTTDPMPDNFNLLNDTNHNERCETINLNTFNLKNRLNFVPKGMSPIFKNCNTKSACHNSLDTDYYQDILYHNFITEVQANSEIYTEQIQNVQDAQMKNKNKTNTHFSLNFDGKSLEYAKVLNQVDNKFIAAVIKNSKKHNEESSNFLVLFDQHAVHERIRLENNLSEYVIDGQWKSVSIDNMTMLLPKDELLYLHNYKEKFAQLGLQWIMPPSNEIVMTAIPEAILGKNPRQPDKILKALRNLITEQINNIKSQNGCISVYPKSIMDLVFSEACRYAVMFGDKLTKDYCEELLKALSKCKKPFQCAHGRPVMAVLMDVEYDQQKYKANFTKLKRFK